MAEPARAPAPGPIAEAVGDTVESRADLFVALDGEGLRLVTPTGSARLLPFGSPAHEIETALERIWGPPDENIELPDCGYEPPVMIGWDQGLNLLTVNGVFVGWSAMGNGESGAVSTMAGLAVGVERRVAESAYEIEIAETTIGIEFETAGISGVFEEDSPDARVRSLWAGRACIYR